MQNPSNNDIIIVLYNNSKIKILIFMVLFLFFVFLLNHRAFIFAENCRETFLLKSFSFVQIYKCFSLHTHVKTSWCVRLQFYIITVQSL